MRWLFLLLVLINVAVLMIGLQWEWGGPESDSADQPPEVASLQLIPEQSAIPAAEREQDSEMDPDGPADGQSGGGRVEGPAVVNTGEAQGANSTAAMVEQQPVATSGHEQEIDELVPGGAGSGASDGLQEDGPEVASIPPDRIEPGGEERSGDNGGTGSGLPAEPETRLSSDIEQRDGEASVPEDSPGQPVVPDGLTADDSRAMQETGVQAGSADEEAPMVTPPGQTATKHCGTLGPLERGARARALAETLSLLDLNSQLRQETEQKPIGYWVYIAPLASRKEAVALVNELKGKGVKDIRRFVRGSLRNGISLGVFASRSNAEQRKATIRKRGYQAQIKNRNIETPIFWIDFEVEGGSLDTLDRLLLEDYPKIGRQDRPCGQIVTL